MVTFQVLYYVTTPDHTATGARRGAGVSRNRHVRVLNWRTNRRAALA